MRESSVPPPEGGVPLTILKYRSGDSVRLELSGSLTLGEPVMLLESAVLAEVAAGIRHIYVDITQLTTIDSAALGSLVALYTRRRSKGVTLHLPGAQTKAKDLLRLTRLLTVFEETTVPLEPDSPGPPPRPWMKPVILWAVIVFAGLIYLFYRIRS
jgi:anti-sigma B factor antagonist